MLLPMVFCLHASKPLTISIPHVIACLLLSIALARESP